MPGIFEALEQEWDHAEHAIADHLHHAASPTPAAQPVTVGTTTPKEHAMGLIADIRNEIAAEAHNLAAHAAQFEQATLPAIAGKLTALEGNPVVDALLRATHVDPAALGIVVDMIDGLEKLYNPQSAPAQPAAPAQ